MVAIDYAKLNEVVIIFILQQNLYFFAISLANVRLYEVFAVVHRITVPRVNKQHFINWCHHFSSKSSSVEFGKKDEDLTSRNTGPDKTFIQDVIFKTGENSDYSDYSSKLYKSHSLLLIFSQFHSLLLVYSISKCFFFVQLLFHISFSRIFQR